MELILIRHGEASPIEFDPTGADPDLSELGRAQAAAMADYLASEQIDALWSSPMKRAWQTAEALSATIGVAPKADDRLAEFDRDDTSYTPPDRGRMTAEYRDHVQSKLEDPEFISQVVECADALVANHPGQRVAAVCHGGVVMHAVAHLVGAPRVAHAVAADYTALARVMVSRSGHVSLKTLNEAPWLRSAT